MNRILIAAAAALLLSVPAFAKGGDKHPNITAAHQHLKMAADKISAAQKANEYDMQGHAAKAKDLIDQAMSELEQARSAANEKK